MSPAGASTTAHRRQGREKDYGDESARRKISETSRSRAITLFQQNNPQS
ncbi:hypothetical protein BREVNS_0903 [Brevinematales bacterium NS]|nr:hypothetical protein BREVNS_0903 [Brevinematales bacterium NS]